MNQTMQGRRGISSRWVLDHCERPGDFKHDPLCQVTSTPAATVSRRTSFEHGDYEQLGEWEMGWTRQASLDSVSSRAAMECGVADFVSVKQCVGLGEGRVLNWMSGGGHVRMTVHGWTGVENVTVDRCIPRWTWCDDEWTQTGTMRLADSTLL